MSSYFGGVSLGEKGIEEFGGQRAGKVVNAANYIGVAPELTTVLYAPGDKMGMAAAIASLIPIGICVALLTVFLCRRTAEDLWVGLGQIGCEVANGVLKIIIKEPRPSSPVTNMPVDSFGMPSAHSQYMGYFAMIIILQTLKARKISTRYRILRIVLALGVSSFIAYSRYYLYYHTGQQVTVGYGVGCVIGFVWFKALDVARTLGLVKWGVGLYPSRLLSVKDADYSVTEEHELWRAESAKKVT